MLVMPMRLPPSPREVPLLGSFPEIQRLGQVRFFEEVWRAHGDLVRFKLGPFVGHVLAHPEHIRHVLVENRGNYRKGRGYAKTREFLGEGLLTSEGDRWQRQRRSMQPPFTARGVVQFAGAITRASTAMVDRWGGGAAFDVDREMLHLTMAIIGETMFGADLGARGAALVQASGDACAHINHRLASFFDVPLWIPTAKNRRFSAALRALDVIIAEIVAGRREAPARDDLLGKLLAAREDGVGMDARQIRDEIVTIFFAGHDTSAEALTWAWYLLARHPDAEHQLHAELGRVLAGRVPTAADLPALPYTRAIVDETLRLYPSVWCFPREAIADDEIGGYHIPGDSQMFPSQYLAHRHPEFWRDPEHFEPDRFMALRAAGKTNPAYLPFGLGPRTCIGNHLAVQVVALVLATAAQRVRLRLASLEPIPPVSIVTLHPSRPVRMIASLR